MKPIDKSEGLRDYLSWQMNHNHLIEDIDKRKYFARHMKVLLEKYIKDFLEGNSEKRWIVMPGLRGVGKTTLLTQVYSWAYKQWMTSKSKNVKINMIYISLDVVRNLGGDLMEVLKIYQSLLNSRLENISSPVLLFIDEIQVDPDWAQILKTVYDWSRNVFIICTGSAATYLQMDADTAGRRAKITRLYPLSFTEYQMLAHNKLPIKNLKQSLIQACYQSASATEVVEAVQSLQPSLDQAGIRYDYNQIESYLQTGTMPFALNQSPADTNQALINNIEKVVFNDLATDSRFNLSHTSVRTIQRLLILLAGSPATPSLQTLSQSLKVDTKNLSEMLNALVKAEVLIRIPAYGNDFTTVRQPVRYQFMSAALRTAYFNITGRQSTAQTRRGRLLEDVAALHYYREFNAQAKGSLTYLYARKDPGHCDFILKITNSHQIALEFGLGQKKHHQVAMTMKTVNCDYGLIFSQSPLKLYDKENIAAIPLRYFFLM